MLLQFQVRSINDQHIIWKGHHFSGGTEFLVAWPGDRHAMLALSAFVHAMAETDRVAIIRYVKVKSSAPKLACCIPRKRAQLFIFTTSRH